MYIENLYIDSFGAIRGRSLDLSEKLNVIEGSNESGKSTIAAFIRFMFYGFSSKGERTLRCPFDSDRMSGTLTLRSGGTRYRIERTVVGTKDDVKVISLDKNEVCFEGKVPGEMFFGISSSIYNQTSYIPQLGSNIDGVSISDAIDNMIFSADEKINIQKALKRLDDARISLKHKKGIGGRISELEAEREALSKRLDNAGANNAERSLLNSRYRELKEKIAQTEATAAYMRDQLNAYIRSVRKNRSDYVNQLGTRIALLEQRLSELREKCTRNGFLPDEEYLNLLNTNEEKLAQIASQISAINEAMKREKPKETAVSEDDDNHIGDVPVNAVAEIARPDDISDRISGLGGKANIYKIIGKLKTERRTLVVFGILFGLLLIPVALLAAVLFLAHSAAAVPAGIGLALILFGMIRCFTSYSKKTGMEDDIYITLCVEDKEDMDRLFAELDSKEHDRVGENSDTNTLHDDLHEGGAEGLSGGADRIYSAESSVILGQQKELLEAQKLLAEKWGRDSALSAARDAERYLSYQNKIITALDKYKAAYASLKSQMGTEDFEADETASDVPLPDNFDYKTVRQSYDAYLKSAQTLRENMHSVELRIAELNSVSEPAAEIADRINILDDQIAYCRRQLVCCRLAYECLKSAGDELRDTVAPRLSGYAGKLINIMSNGKYSSLGVDSSFSMSYNAGHGGMHITKGIEYMSAGTQDIAYLSLRLSLLQILCRDNMPPLVFDESFARLDDKRLAQTFRLLSVMAKAGVQVIIFTAQQREGALVGDSSESEHILLA